MPSFVPPKKNTEYITYVSLVSQADANLFQTNPTLAAGDVKVSTDGGAEGNITTLPVVTPAGSKRVKITLSAAEMNGDNITVTFSDAAGAEWADLTLNIPTSANQIDDSALASALATHDGKLDIVDGNVDDTLALLDNRLAINKATSELWLYNTAGDTVIKKWPLTDKDGNAVVLQGTGPANRGIQSL